MSATRLQTLSSLCVTSVTSRLNQRSETSAVVIVKSRKRSRFPCGSSIPTISTKLCPLVVRWGVSRVGKITQTSSTANLIVYWWIPKTFWSFSLPSQELRQSATKSVTVVSTNFYGLLELFLFKVVKSSFCLPLFFTTNHYSLIIKNRSFITSVTDEIRKTRRILS